MSQAGVDQALARLDRDSWNGYLDELRTHERRQLGWSIRAADPDEDFTTVEGEFRRSDPGYPLGRGYPGGRSLREEGESHRDAWARLVRSDPCSYCGGPGGTVDHVEPKRGENAAAPGHAETWLNYAGACESCNGSKGAEPMLLWLLTFQVDYHARCRAVARTRRRARRAAVV